MRRKDREVTDPAKIAEIISRCTCCRVGFCDSGEVYIVPLSFGYEIKDGGCTLYFHGAKEGRKIDLIRKNPEVGFEMDTDCAIYAVGEAETACDYTARFQSVVGNGVMSIVPEAEEKRLGLTLLMEHNAGKREWAFHEKMVEAVTVFKLKVTKLSCKEHR